MILREARVRGAFVVELEPARDERGFFARTFSAEEFAGRGLTAAVAECSVSFNPVRFTLRGLHYQRRPYEEAKLVRCPRGAILDVLVDVREGSPAFGQWEAFELDDQNARQLYAPEGFAHGFCVTSALADVIYKCSAYYDPELEGGFRYDDPEVGIEWPGLELAVSERDRTAPRLAELRELPVNFPAG
jgi:dTDP-4-dehydrorhamnose 3,5-epimerase